MSPSSTTPLIELPEDEQTSGKTSNSPGAASGQVNITYSTRTSDSERSFEASNHPTLASSSAEASLVQAIHAYNSHVQSAGQRQVEDTLRRLLDEKFSDLQKRRGQSNEERWLKAIDQICRAQHSLAKEVREMRLQLLRLGDLHRHAVSVSRSVTSSSNVEKGYHTPGPEQSVGTTGFAWDSVDHSGCMGSTMFSGNTVLNDGRWTDPYSRQ